MTFADLVTQLQVILGVDAVLHRQEDVLLYDCDAYTLAKAVPRVVVLPESTEAVTRVIGFAFAHNIPVVPRGAGTGLSGGSLAAPGCIMVVLTRMRRIWTIDAPNRRALVDAGVVNLTLNDALKPYGMAFAPDPSSQSACTIGGNLAQNAGGPHTLKYGVTVNHVLAAEVVLADGTVVWLGEETEDPVGYDLLALLIGSEGTLGIFTRAWVRLTPLSAAIRTTLAIFPDIDAASSAVSAIIASGILPSSLELMDAVIMQAVEAAFQVGFPADAGAVLLVEVDGVAVGLDALQARIEALCTAQGATSLRQAQDAADRAKLWQSRKKAVGAVGRLAPSKVTQDGVIPRSKLPMVLRRIAAIAEEFGLLIGNVFHAGDGNLHPIILFDERDPNQVQRVHGASAAILRACLDAGGSITGEHGVGVEKEAYIAWMFDADSLACMALIKAVFDPNQRLNPGKLVPLRGGCAEFPQSRKVVNHA